MRIAIIGTGKVGRALGGALATKGHDVTYGSRTPSGPDQGLAATAAAGAEVVILALPWRVAEEAVKAFGPLTGKVVIDCMNPIAIGPDGMGLAIGHSTSGGEVVQERLPDAHVVKTLNQVGAEVMADTTGFATPPVQFVAGEDDAAKATVASLLTDLGFQPLDAGGIAKARLLEPLALVWINQSLAQGHGRNWALTAQPRQKERSDA